MKVGKQLVLPVLILVAGGFVATACEADKSTAEQPRVFFVEPKDGATVTSPLHMKFGSEGIEIAAVPPGELTKAQVRKGVAHYHVGIDQSCLPPGQNIVKGTPSWVHFGDGKDVFDSQLTPGEHKLALQLGDDLHDTMPGACQEITVTVK
jgi:Domain of unknown function (DUF4399)